MRVAGAAAEVALKTVSDLLASRFGVALEQLNAAHNHAGRAVATLQAVALPETLLHRVQLAVLRQSFDRGDVRTIGLDCQNRAGFDGAAIQQNCASAADAGFATNVGDGQFAMVA